MNPTFDELLARARTGDVRARVEVGLALEAMGRPGDGIDWLAGAARSGDVEALTLVGIRLSAGRFGPGFVGQGLTLLQEASGRGGADAAARLAVLHAAGAHMRQDWTLALDLLQRAAELGHSEARVELAILSGAADEAVLRRRTQPGVRLRESIDIGALLAPGEATEVLSSPRIRRLGGFASPTACAWLIERARPRLARAEIQDPASGRTKTAPERNNRSAAFDLENTNLVALALQQKMAASCGMDLAACEPASVLCYELGEQAREHFDFLDPAVPAFARDVTANGQRIATGLVYLNEDYCGGATEFPRLGVTHQGRLGSALVFANVTADGQPDVRTLHAGRPPSAGVKWVLSCFVRGRPPGATTVDPGVLD